MRFHDALFAAAGAGGAPPAPWSPADIPSQLLRIDAAAGFTLSGTDVVAIADQSSAAETITITGTPQYTVSDANLNGEPSFEIVASSGITAANVNRASIAFTAVVAYLPSASLFFWDADEASNRHYGRMNAAAFQLSGDSQGITGEPVAGRKRILAPNDGATTGLFNGASMTVIPAGSASGSGIVIGRNYVGSGYGARVAFFMQCSAVPSSGDLALLEAYLLARFG